jgi:SAM-dependent methyltransferase
MLTRSTHCKPKPPMLTEIAFSAPADRNKQPILDVLRQVLPAQGRALEIASGTGQHVAWFAAHLPRWTWQPSDRQADLFPSITARVTEAQLSKVQPPLLLDVMAAHWLPDAAHGQPPLFDLVYCANMLHISPWATCAALMQGSARHLAPGGRLVTYGPYLEEDMHTSVGNTAFDQSLRAQDPAWGIRQREQVEQEASRAGLQLAARHAMPANNLLLVWTRVA